MKKKNLKEKLSKLKEPGLHGEMVDFRARSGKIENESRRLCCKRIKKYLKYDKVGILLSNFFKKMNLKNMLNE